MLIIISVSAGAQDSQIVSVLKTEGFEDIRAKVIADTLYLTIEDRAHRGTFRGAVAAIRQVTDTCPEIQNFEMVLTDYKMPQLIVHAFKRDGTWDVSVDRHMKQALEVLSDVKPQAASTGKIDITVFPMVSLVNNKLDHLFDYCVSIAPAFAATLWPGARLTLQPIFPILYQLDQNDTKRFIQIGNTNLSQQILSTKHWHLSAAAGFFHTERAGVQAKAIFHAIRNLDISLEAGYTYGFNYTRAKGIGFIRDSQQFNFMARASYYERHRSLWHTHRRRAQRGIPFRYSHEWETTAQKCICQIATPRVFRSGVQHAILLPLLGGKDGTGLHHTTRPEPCGSPLGTGLCRRVCPQDAK